MWLVSEDNSPEFLGPYGDPLANTPTLDQLARDGVVYDNAYATAPVCAPSRFSIITGMYASSFAPANQMRALGSNHEFQGTIPNWLRGFPAYLRDAGYYCTNNAKEDYNAPIDVADAWDESSRTAHWRNRPDGTPFFAVFNYMTTHESALHPGRSEALVKGVDPASVSLPAYCPDLPEIRADRAKYYDQNTALDGQLRDRLAELETDGLADDTIVIYFGDHGGVTPGTKRFCYDRGLRVPLIVRVPDKWRHLWPSEPGTRVDEMVSLMDMGPTALSLAGLGVPHYMHGRAIAGPARTPAPTYSFGFRNRMDERYDVVRTVRDDRYRYVRNYLPHLPNGQHVEYMYTIPSMQAWYAAHRAGQLTAVEAAFFGPRAFEELFDRKADPDEIENLADDPDMRPVLDRLRAVLDEHMLHTHDNAFVPEGSPLEGRDLASDDIYPLERLLAVATTAAQRSTENIPRLIEWLHNDAEPVRYWAAVGCVALRDDAKPARKTLTALLHDESPQVRVVAAEALCWIGDVELARPILDELTADHEHDRVRLQAINALDALSERIQPSAAVVASARQDPSIDVRKVANHLID